MAGTIPDELLLARIRKETKAREAAFAALKVALENATAEAQERTVAVASKLSAQIGSRTVDAQAISGIILRTQVEPGFALAEQVTTLEARVDTLDTTSQATITEIRSTMADQYEAQAQQTLTLQAVFNKNIATVTEQITVVANATSAVATRTTALEATVNNPTTGVVASYARILAEETVRATADSALATRATTLEATVFSATDGNAALKARISTEETARANADSALATRATTLEATVFSATDGNAALKARISTEETARANADSALASRATSLEATVNDPTTGVVASYARILSEETVRATADSALATRTTALESSLNTPTTGLIARVTTVESTKVDASGAYAQASSAITASLSSTSAGTIGAAINTEAVARALADGRLSSQYVLSLNANGTVAGMSVTAANGLSGGIGYTSSPTVTFSGGGGSDAAGTAVIMGGRLASVTVTNSGSGYTSAPTVTFSGGGGTGAAGAATVVGGQVVSVTVTSRGSGYTSPPTVSFSGGGGAGAAGVAALGAEVVSVTITNPGSGYTSPPTVTFSGGGGTGALGVATVLGGAVTGVFVQPTSEVAFTASSFKVYNGTTTVAPFQVVGGQVRITGDLVLQQADIPAIDWGSQVTGTGKPANNADVTLSAINGGLTITSGGLTLNGTPSIKSNNYVAGSAGWAIKGDGSVEFADGTFRGTIDVGSGDTRFYKPTAGAATYGNTAAGHIAMQNYAIGTASLRLNHGTNTKVDIRAQPVGTDIVGTIYVFNADSSSFLQISGSVVSGGGARLTWNGDTNLYRHTAGILKTDTDFEVVGGFKFRNCPMTQRVAKSHVLTTAGGSAEETFNIDISGYGFTAKPTAGSCECASDKDYKARYDWDAAGNSSTNAVIKVSRFDGANTGAATLRFSLIFVQ